MSSGPTSDGGRIVACDTPGGEGSEYSVVGHFEFSRNK
jgi:hypothetical protein